MTAPIETTADAGVPEAADQDARLMTHAYDGIREYDNPLPGWWKAIFAGSFVFAVCYGFYFHIANWGQSPGQRYQAALADYQDKRGMREAAEAANVSEDTLMHDVLDPKILAHGAEVFAARCVPCHGPEGAGVIGPNLTDLEQLHGSTRMDLYNTITQGVQGTAMLAWGEQLPQTDILAVATFVTTLRGKNLPGKAPQGSPVQPFKSAP